MRYKFRRANKSKRMGIQSVFQKKFFVLLKMKKTVDLIISVETLPRSFGDEEFISLSFSGCVPRF